MDGWQAPVVVVTSDEMYRRIVWVFVSFMEISCHPW